MTNKPITTVDYVDLERFMGDWYVIANIPTIFEKGAHNPIESYRLDEKGLVQTTFSYNKDAFNGVRKSHHPVGFVRDKKTNSVWGMQFIWPFKADYRIVYLDGDYTQTIVGREKRDYVWLMARSPQISEDEYRHLLDVIAKEGYDITKVEKTPQKW